MATPFESTPKWFDSEFYLAAKLAQLQAAEPNAGWTRDKMNTAFVEAGFKNPYDHYQAYGDAEDVSPNSVFNADEYLAAKAAAMGGTWTKELVRQAIKDAGLTLTEHYAKYGFSEGINPSKSFDQNKYLDAKLEQLMATDPKGEWTLEKVKEAFVAGGITPMEHYMTYGKTEGLQDPKYDYAENGKPIPHPGNDKIALTEGTDVVSPTATDTAMQTSSRDDLISGVVSSISSKATLNANDVIDGGTGRDVLKLDMQGNFSGFKDGSVKNVETIALENVASLTTSNGTFNAKGVQGAELYTVNVGAKDFTISNVDTVATAVEFGAQANGKLSFLYTDAALAGKEDVASVTLKSVGSASGDATLKVAGATTAVMAETLALNSTGTENFLKVESAHTGIVVSGDADLNVATAAGLKTFDASAATGSVDADLTKSLGSIKTAIGGQATDDVFTISGATDVPIKATISGFETLAFGKNDKTVTMDMSGVTGVTAVQFDEKNTVSLKGGDQTELDLLLKETAVSGSSFTYSGKGALSVASFGEGANATANEKYGVVEAKSVTDLTITNGSANNALTLVVDARQAETVVIDTGTAGVNLAELVTVDKVSTWHTSTLTSMQTLEIKGEGDAMYRAAAGDTALTSVNAAELKGDLILRLGDANTAKLASIEAGAGDDTISVGTMASGGTIVGGDGADWIRGSDGNDIIYAGSAAANGSDRITETNTEMMRVFNGKAFTITSNDPIHWLTDDAKAVLTDANVVEGDMGDDTIYASNQKDVFLFQTGGAGEREDEPSFTDLGHDTIYGFNTKVDKLMIMDQDSANEGVTTGARGFSAEWDFDSTTLSANTGTFHVDLATKTREYSPTELTFKIGNEVAVEAREKALGIAVTFGEDGATILIHGSVLTGSSCGETHNDLKITLAGVTEADIATGKDLMNILGSSSYTVTPAE